MKLFVRLILTTFILFFFSADVLAENVKLGVVDMAEFRKQSVAFQKSFAAMKKRADALQVKLDQEKEALRKLEEDYEKQKMMLSLDAQEDKRLAVDKKRRYVKYLYEDFTYEMKAADAEATKKIAGELEKIVRQIGEKNGYTLIIEKRTMGLIYYNTTVDITDQVVRIYDSQHR